MHDKFPGFPSFSFLAAKVYEQWMLRLILHIVGTTKIVATVTTASNRLPRYFARNQRSSDLVRGCRHCTKQNFSGVVLPCPVVQNRSLALRRQLRIRLSAARSRQRRFTSLGFLRRGRRLGRYVAHMVIFFLKGSLRIRSSRQW